MLSKVILNWICVAIVTAWVNAHEKETLYVHLNIFDRDIKTRFVDIIYFLLPGPRDSFEMAFILLFLIFSSQLFCLVATYGKLSLLDSCVFFAKHFFIQVVYKLKSTADLQVHVCTCSYMYTLLTKYLNMCIGRTFVKYVSFIFTQSVHY